MGNRSDFASIYEQNLKNAMTKNRQSCGGRNFKSKADPNKEKENLDANAKNNSFSKKCPLSAHPSHYSSQSQASLLQPQKSLPFTSKTEHQTQFTNPLDSFSGPC